MQNDVIFIYSSCYCIISIIYIQYRFNATSHSHAGDSILLASHSKSSQGWIQELVRGGAKFTQWRRMRRLSSRTRMYGSILLHKFFATPLIFPSEEQKKKGLNLLLLALLTITKPFCNYQTFHTPLFHHCRYTKISYLNSLKNVTCQCLALSVEISN